MGNLQLIDEMAKVVLGLGQSPQFSRLLGIGLEGNVVRLGCMRILEWLRSQAVQMKVRPTRLRENSELDMACMRLVREGAGSLGLVFEVQGETLSFSKGITVEEARELMRRAQEVYRPPLVRRA